MGTLKNLAKLAGDMAESSYERNKKIDEMTREIVKRGYQIDPIEARKVAKVLVAHADVTWK